MMENTPDNGERHPGWNPQGVCFNCSRQARGFGYTPDRKMRAITYHFCSTQCLENWKDGGMKNVTGKEQEAALEGFKGVYKHLAQSGSTDLSKLTPDQAQSAADTFLAGYVDSLRALTGTDEPPF